MSTVTLSLAKAYSNIIGDEDDELLTLFIDAAETWLGNYIGKPIAEFDPVPADLKRAVLMLVAFYYEQREAVAYGIAGQMAPLSVVSIAESYRISRFGVTVEEPADGV
ncbi:MAG: head-tail connector protein [Mesorhizobium sp.]